mmetsp:Transcript_16097/g.47246  ORF Transcript_16097/g.47246 Transcript_16097/m.47246 type:complete len:247 (-) Transcript_16097:481-1221(-)
MAAPECCPPGSWPCLSGPEDYTPRGADDMLEDLPIYVVGEPGEKAIVVMPDIYGTGQTGRLKGLCDTLADQGYFVVMADPFRTDTAEGKEDFVAWVTAFPFDGLVAQDIQRVMAYVEGKGATSVGAMGFCWGVWAICKASATGVPFKCGVGPHPSTQLEGLFGGNELEMMAAVSMPLLMMPAGNDRDTLKEGGEVAAAIAAGGGSSVTFPDMVHGFTIRGDITVPEVKRDVELAVGQAIEHFKAHL